MRDLSPETRALQEHLGLYAVRNRQVLTIRQTPNGWTAALGTHTADETAATGRTIRNALTALRDAASLDTPPA